MTATRRLCFALDLVDEAAAIAAYREAHRPGGPPAGVLQRLRARGVVAMEIWLTGNRLMMVMEATEDFLGSSDQSDHPEDQAWEAAMSRFQTALPGADGAKWQPMEKIFSL